MFFFNLRVKFYHTTVVFNVLFRKGRDYSKSHNKFVLTNLNGNLR